MGTHMQDFQTRETVRSFLSALAVTAEDGIVVAVSGGADSMTLLDALCAVRTEYFFRMVAAHVHHGLRGAEADRDADFVVAECQKRNVPIEVLRTDVAANTIKGESVEQAGRRIRYEFFEQVRQKYGFAYVATAHTADDNLETVLFHLTRGAGLHGLCGISPRANGIIRPLLTCTREQIEAYCTQHNVAFVTDSTNVETEYSRNRIRHLVIPQLKMLNPKVVDACTRMTADLMQEDAYLHEQASALLTSEGIPVASLQEAAIPIRRRAIKLFAEKNGGDPERKHVLIVEEMIALGYGTVQIPGGITLTVLDDFLQLRQNTTEIPYFELPLTLNDVVEINGNTYRGLCLSRTAYETKQKVYKNVLKFSCDYGKITRSLIVRQRKQGDAFHPVGGVGKTLKKYFNEKNVPINERLSTPIVCDEKGIVLVTGFSCDERVKLDETTKQVLVFYPVDGIEEEKSCGNT